MKQIAIASLALILATPAAAQPPRLTLSLADANRDGAVSQEEAAAVLVQISGVADFKMTRPRAAAPEPQPSVLEPGPLDLDRRIVPASEFERANEQAFLIEKRRRD
ncbi:hypothetical protein [Caulobacter sp. DWR1-3-2b1]|uniref:hypothetical protein n=1 Tax=Caulobacter sp. DWR1-3-2b1 TaxID=2804670 RepID=UPI003CEEFC28